MVTEKEWLQAKEEFGEQWTKRFDGDFKCLQKLNFKPLSELFAHDVKIYGKNAYLIWEFKRIGHNNWEQPTYNYGFEFAVNCEKRRKLSAALPFNLERAKAGDVVEWFNGKEWVVISWHENGLWTDLRMKYPPKIKG